VFNTDQKYRNTNRHLDNNAHLLTARSSAGRVDALEDFRRNELRLTESGIVSKSTSTAAPRDLAAAAAAARSSATSASFTQHCYNI